MMKKAAAFAVLALAGLMALAGCKKESNKVVIYSTSEDYRIEYMQKRLNEQFPQYDIAINYYPTGNLAAKLKAEGVRTECDIIGELESGYMEGILDNLADLSSYDSSVFLPEIVPAHHKYLPFYKGSGCIIYSQDFLRARNLPVPSSYQDLLNPVYKGVLTMPNPKSSSTGYFFLKNLVNAMGEDEAFAWFDGFANNVLQFTSSGSGPVNALVQGEAGIGLGMTFQAVTTINNGVPLSIKFFDEGSPYSLYALGIIKGKDSRKAVKDVFDFYLNTVSREDKERFVPEQIFKNQVNTIPNYPANVKSGDMRGIEILSEKERLLEKWKY
ncbi:extracellular solute-binding protein [Leadbettera azotonutricia]|uniref:Putative ABC transporter, substrate-binding protein n=1 Tax=Leadbettera azotonutricia (strain ATCC BAA-888 / DSM 13862 / ZAS-9) TaxID=545695 RepID=F5YAY0_LEAAZ|nr:extracellular solute-binding protein [Leadbettera azotonutricia]AEF82913.1 putative ABC transporter, substrate-binding protein [Leadbettera azotonutricia ZAS-9]